jgi:hypothetical protein
MQAMPPAVPAEAGSWRRDAWLAGLLSALLFAAAHGHALGEPLLAADDVRQQIFWMYKWLEPGLLQGDLLAGYAERYVPWGERGLYWLASHVVEPMTFSKLLPGVLFAVLGVAACGIGRALGGRGLGWAALAVAWCMPIFLDRLVGGLPRAFAGPLFLLFILFWLTGRGWAMGVVLVLTALFIPYMFLPCAAAAGLAWMAWKLRAAGPPPFPRRPGHWALGFLAAGLVAAYSLNLSVPGYGPMVWLHEMAGRPEFGPDGRERFLPLVSPLVDMVWAPLERLAPFRQAGPVAGGAVLAGLGVLLVAGLRRVRWSRLLAGAGPLAFAAAASLICYAVARAVMFQLFVPSRYVLYMANLLLALLVAAALHALLAPRVGRLGRPAAGAAVLLALAFGLAAVRLHGLGLDDFRGRRGVIEAARQTPAGSVFASHPFVLDNVLAFARRPVVAGYELAHPWSEGLWRRLDPRLEATLRAYYADDPEAVVSFCRAFGVDYLIVDERHFRPAFLRGQGRTLLLHQALGVPDPVGRVLARLGLPAAVAGPPAPDPAVPPQRPFFAPYDRMIREQVRRQAQGGAGFALLDRSRFPGREVQPGVRLVMVKEIPDE